MSKTLTLDEAAKRLGITPEQFKVNLKTVPAFRVVRPLMGGATIHFRATDIEELARRLGHTSDADLVPGDNAKTDPNIAPLDAGDEEQIDIGRDIGAGGPASSARLSGSRSGVKKPASPPPAAEPPMVIADSSDDVFTLLPESARQKAKKPDSDVRLDKAAGGKVPHGTPTEEIDLDEEKKKANAKKPPSSEDIFILAEDAPKTKPASSGRLSKPIKPDPDDDSSEFELKLAPDSSDEFELEITDSGEEVDLGTLPKSKAGSGKRKPDSGINLKKPADSGISLERDDSDEFELNLDAATSGRLMGGAPKSDKKKKDDSDSEFELTLDDSSELAPDVGKDKDIFETDFDIPALDDDSGANVGAGEGADTDLESSDFDLALDEGDAADASGSEVVELPDEVDEPSAAEELADVDEDEEEEVRPAAAMVAAPPPWGPLPAIILLPCTLIMFFVALMGYELVRGISGYQQTSNPVTRFVAGMFMSESELPK